MGIYDSYIGNIPKVAEVAGKKRQAVGEGSSGDDSIGQLHAVLLAQADGVLGHRLIKRQHFHTLYK